MSKAPVWSDELCQYVAVREDANTSDTGYPKTVIHTEGATYIIDEYDHATFITFGQIGYSWRTVTVPVREYRP